MDCKRFTEGNAMTRKRALTLFFGLLLAGWLVLAQALDFPLREQAPKELVKEDMPSDSESQELRVKLLLLGVEFVIERTTASN